MKRFFSVGLLVSILVAIQFFAGCASGPQTGGSSQKTITITGISPEFNGKYATVGFEENNAAVAASLPDKFQAAVLL